MRKNKSIVIKVGFILLTGTFFLQGCSKNLEETPTSFISPVTYYNNPDQILSSIAGSINVMKQGWVLASTGLITWLNDDQFNGGSLVIPQDFGTFDWDFTYKAIQNVNAAIDAMEAGKLKSTPINEVNVLMGQAKFIRAWNYFMLVRLFGGVPLVTEKTIDPSTANIPRSSIEDVYGLIISDFEYAIATLPASWPPSQRGRPTRDAAKGLLAKAYLTMATQPLNKPEHYQNAADMAKQVIDGGVYHLVKDINDVFGFDTEYGPEMMWSFNSNNLDRGPSPKGWAGSPDGSSGQVPDPRFVDGDSTYQAYPRQPRLHAYIQMYPRNVADTTGQRFSENGRLPGVKKFMYDSDADWAGGVGQANQPIIRYADVLLIFAEAENMASGGPTQAAVDAVNQIIDRANGYVLNDQDPLATLDMSKEAFDVKVMQERSWELCFEMGNRWFDLVRKRMLEDVTRPEYQKNFTPDDYLFPIPSQDIVLNPLLTQNPGY